MSYRHKVENEYGGVEYQTIETPDEDYDEMKQRELDERMEAMAKFTPGPWTLTARSDMDVLVGAFEIRGMFGDKPNVYPIFQQSRSAIDGAEIYLHPADANLIAAAPEMYEALKAVQRTLSAIDISELAQTIDAAIAKAEGVTK